MHYFFASLNEHGICTGIQQANGNPGNCIDVTQQVIDGTPVEDFLWRKYVDGQWSVEKFLPPAPEPQPDAQAEIEALRAKDAEIILTLVMNDLM